MMVPMDLRSLPDGLTPKARCDERRSRIEQETGLKLGKTETADDIGTADETNCEQMFGAVPVPVGYAGPLKMTFSDGTSSDIHLPLATTEGALVASVNRGCKALSMSGGVRVESSIHGITRSIAWKAAKGATKAADALKQRLEEWVKVAEATSSHLKILSWNTETMEDHVFLLIAADTDEAMGMNMVTVAAQAVGEWAEKEIEGFTFVTVAANVDSDKKPSLRTYENGRGTEVIATADISEAVIKEVLKTDSATVLGVARAKIELGSELAGALGRNLHAANIVAALYLATGQDVAHVVEGSLADTTVEKIADGIRITVRSPALLTGVRGGGTALPAQKQCLDLLMTTKTSLKARVQLAESIGAAVLAGELSLLAAQASHSLAAAHAALGRKKMS